MRGEKMNPIATCQIGAVFRDLHYHLLPMYLILIIYNCYFWRNIGPIFILYTSFEGNFIIVHCVTRFQQKTCFKIGNEIIFAAKLTFLRKNNQKLFCFSKNVFFKVNFF